VGIVITSDGSFGELTRTGYELAEARTIQELKQLNKPFILLLNSLHPYHQETKQLAESLKKKYDCNVLPVSCEQLRKEDIYTILKSIRLEFPVTALHFYIPKWVESLSQSHWLKASLLETIETTAPSIQKMKDLYEKEFPQNEYMESMKIDRIDLSNGKVDISVHFDDSYYYKTISDMIQIPVTNEHEFIDTIRELAEKKKEYEEAAFALGQARLGGYGILKPTRSDVTVKEPEMIRHGGKYGVKIHASAPSIHLIKANISTEIAPIVGTEEQARDLVQYIKEETSKGEDAIWNVNIFGKTMEQMIAEGIQEKASKINNESQQKLQNTMEKIVNEGNGGMVCIII